MFLRNNRTKIIVVSALTLAVGIGFTTLCVWNNREEKLAFLPKRITSVNENNYVGYRYNSVDYQDNRCKRQTNTRLRVAS